MHANRKASKSVVMFKRSSVKTKASLQILEGNGLFFSLEKHAAKLSLLLESDASQCLFE